MVLKYTESILSLALSGYYDLGFKRKHCAYSIADVKQGLEWFSFDNRKWNLEIEHKHFHLKRSKVVFLGLGCKYIFTFFGGIVIESALKEVIYNRETSMLTPSQVEKIEHCQHSEPPPVTSQSLPFPPAKGNHCSEFYGKSFFTFLYRFTN